MEKQAHEELMAEIARLTAINEAQAKELERLRTKEKEMNEIISGEYFKPIRNERNAGRKPVNVTAELKESITSYRKQGLSFKEISKNVGLSVGTVHKICRT